LMCGPASRESWTSRSWLSPRPRVSGRAGARNRGALRFALALGADLAGGAPALDDQPDRAVESLAWP
jgi:hypothetical protein